MSSPTFEKIAQLEQQTSKSFAVARRPSDFLSLAPTTSDTYPQAPAATGRPFARRSSSDANKNAAGLQFLKLGPVHFGEHHDEE